MEHPFETPHPSIQTRDQIFKLPSSQPLCSPNLSPVPVAITRSRNLKENRASTPWTEHTSKTLTSGGRSASVSSSNSSSSSKSREHQMNASAKKSLKANMKPRSYKPRKSKSGSRSGLNLARALASPFVSRASSPINDQGSYINPNDLPPPPKHEPISRTSTATNLGKRGLSDTFYNPNLPSPRSQTHTVPEGLHERQKGRIYHVQSAHTSPPSNAPASVLLDLNTQSKQKRRKGGHRGTVSVDGTRGNGATKFDLREDLGGGGKTEKKQEGQQRDRRPSAPSSYSHRSRPRALLLLSGASVGSQGNKTRRSRLPSGLEIIHNVNNDGAASTCAATTAGISTAPTGTSNHTIDDDGFVLPLPPNENIAATTNSVAAPDMEMNWRVGIVDFNRPPSQMCHYPTTMMLGGWVGGDVFSSSGSEESEGSASSEEDENNELKGAQTMTNPTRASRTRTQTARPLTSGSGSGFDDPFSFGFGFGSVLPLDLDSNLTVNLDMDLDSRFGDGAWGISTPLNMQIQRQAREEEKERKERKENRMITKASSTSDLRSKNGGLVKMRSLPVMGGVGGRGMELDDHDDVNVNGNEDEQGTYDQRQKEQGEQDMDLTIPLITATAGAGAASTTLGATQVMQLVDGIGDRTPWIMDSLISPPSQFLKIQGEIDKGGYPTLEDGDGDEECVQDQEEQDGGNLSSKTLSSTSPSESNTLSSPFGLSPDQLQSAATLTTAAPATATATAASLSAKRTRSGTIVPSSRNNPNSNSNSDPPGTRRTRSGTLVGPLPLPSTASGSGVQLVVGNGNPSLRRTRERSGTILAGPSPSPVGVGARRTRSGTVIGRAPPPPPPIPVSASVSLPILVSGGRSTRQTELGAEILEEDMPTTSSPRSSNPGNIDPVEYLVDDALDEFNNSDVDIDVEPHVDALYMPRQSASPDPIDFLRLANFQDYDGMREKHRSRFGFGLTIEKQENEDPDVSGGGAEKGMGDEMAWCIADEPPSPVLPKNENKLMMGRRNIKGEILSVRGGHGGVRSGVRGTANGKGRRGKGMKGKGETGRTRTRFVIDGHEERPDEIVVEREEGEDSDDELLLRDGSTLGVKNRWFG